MLNEKKRSGLILLTAPHINAPHAFTTRFGGVSRGPYESLNLGSNVGDHPEAARENRRRLYRAIEAPPNTHSVMTHQVHGDRVYTLTHKDAIDTKFRSISVEADALVTDIRRVPLIVFTSDCVPLLLHDPVLGIVAAVHAGWRGTVADIAGKAVDTMLNLGSDPLDIRAAIGPAISDCCFETGQDVYDAVRAMPNLNADAYVTPKKDAPGKYYISLKGINRSRLVSRGVPDSNILTSHECTLCTDEAKYWSHRRFGSRRGCQGAIIMLN